MSRLLLASLLTFSAAASAYELKRDSSGEPVRWQTAAAFTVDSNLGGKLGDEQTFAAVQRAVDAVKASAPGLSLSVRSGEAQGVGYDFSGGANQNDIVAVDDWTWDSKAIAVTIVTVDAKTHRILDADIALNTKSRSFKVLPDSSKADGTSAFDDVQNTLTHELGHAVGLAHNPDDVDAVMYPAAKRGEVTKRVLSVDDLAALAFLYSGSAPSASSGDGADAPVGCSASGGGVAGMLPVVLVGLLLLFKRRRAAVAASLLIAAAASASDVRREAAPVKDSQATATATVVSRRTLAPKSGERLLRTELTVRTVKCIKGSCPEGFTLTVPGGRYGDVEQVVEGLEVPNEGELVALTVAPGEQTASPAPSRVRLYRMVRAVDAMAFVEGLSEAEQAGSVPTRR